jgi:hypothetical protein
VSKAGLAAKGVAGYLATQVISAAIDTGIEYGATRALGGKEAADNFSLGGAFLKNVGINIATGGVANKAKWLGRVGSYLVRHAIRVAGETGYDVGVNDKDLGTSLIINSVSGVVSDGAGRVIVGIGRRALNSSAGQTVRTYVGGFVEGLGRMNPARLHSSIDAGLVESVANGHKAGKAAVKKATKRASIYEASSKHHPNARGEVSRGPTNGQKTLENSIQVKGTSPRRVAVDPATGEFIVFDKTSAGVFHGHVRTWSELTPQMRNVLIKAGQVTKKGKIIQ